ncbi:four-helix bundle copper-binding protein, partial [Cronobacter sakazakii]|uniref:four-helix bundle copper-binding protein n=1 Tax=Cronobacter sakazakii TaxID=28141 RepID=UPI001319D62C
GKLIPTDVMNHTAADSIEMDIRIEPDYYVAEECGKHDHDHCQRCAEACKKCADACRKMLA